jgi:hypothetical protein
MDSLPIRDLGWERLYGKAAIPDNTTVVTIKADVEPMSVKF